MRGWTLGAVVFAATGCASTSVERPFHEVAEAVEQRSGHRVLWDQGATEDRQAEQAVRALLSRELTVDGAVQIALLRNQSLQATYEELGIAQADLVQAGLLRNPTFSVAVVPSEHDTLQPPIVGSVAVDFLDLFTLPARKKIAATQLEAAKMRVGDAVLELAAEVRSAYFAVQGAQQVVAMRRTIAAAADAAAELAAKQRDAGNINDLDLTNEQALAEQARLDLELARGDVLGARERLTELMGLWGEQTQWRVADHLPELPAAEGPLEHLESLALTQRLDVAARRRELETLSRTLSFVESTRWTGEVRGELAVQPLSDPSLAYPSGARIGSLALAPGASVALPIFDQGQAAVARVEAMVRQSQRRLDALAIEVRSEVRAARDRVAVARRVVVQYRRALVPLREKAVELSQELYNAMLFGVYQLILAKEAEVNTYREYIDAVRDYWIARSDLERAVGGRIGPPPSSAGVGGAAPPAMDHSQMPMGGHP